MVFALFDGGYLKTEKLKTAN